MNITRPGRYALDRAGKLHPMRRRYWADIVAIVHVRPVKSKKCEPREFHTADDASGCEGRAAAREPAQVVPTREPSVPIRPAAARACKPERIAPVNARQSRPDPAPRVTKAVTPPVPPRPKPPLIDLSQVPSSMELRAAGWRKP